MIVYQGLHHILMNYLFNIPGMTEFPCSFPCPWRNKTFNVYKNGTKITDMKFGSDGQSHINVIGLPSQCYQITERFLIYKYVNV